MTEPVLWGILAVCSIIVAYTLDYQWGNQALAGWLGPFQFFAGVLFGAAVLEFLRTFDRERGRDGTVTQD